MTQSECQRLLTVGTRAIGGIPDRGEGGVRLQEVGDDLRALYLQLVAAQTANKNGIRVLLTVGTRARGGVLERLKCRVLLESLREVLSTLSTELVLLETVRGDAFRVSAADSREIGEWRRTGDL